MRNLLVALVMISGSYLSSAQSVKILSMNDGPVAGKGIAKNLGEFVSLSSYTKVSTTSAVLNCFAESNQALLWTRQISFPGLTPTMLITEESSKGTFKNLQPKNMYYVAAEIEDGDFGNKDILLLKLNPAGAVLWAYSFGEQGDEELRCLKSNGNGVMIGGSTKSFDNDIDPFYCRIDSNGKLLWSTVINQSGTQVNANLTQLNNSYYFAGNTTTNGFGRDDMCFGKLDANGSLEWYKVTGTSDGEGAHEIHAHKDNLYFGGVQTLSSGNKGLAILKTDTTGSIAWKFRISGNGNDNLVEFDIINDTIFTTGTTSSYGGGMKDLFLTKISLQGQLLGHNAVGGLKNELFTRSTIIPLNNTFMLAWESESYTPYMASMLVEFDSSLSAGCKVDKGALSRTKLSVKNAAVTPNMVYNKLKIKPQKASSLQFDLDSIYHICGSTPTSVLKPEPKTASLLVQYHTQGNQLKIESNEPIRFQIFDLSGMLIAENTQMATLHQVTMLNDSPKLAIAVVVDANGNSTYRKLLISF